MDLWIRSQDKKKLIKVNEIKIESVIDGNSFIYSDATDLGTYKSKERALEVLDEIQNLFKLEIINETFERSDLLIKAKMLPIVYKMPED
jgi:activator of HSP90 ATPase